MWEYEWQRQVDRAYLYEMFDETFLDKLKEIFSQRPSRVDYLVCLWNAASVKHKKRLYIAILCGVPILECLEWGIKNDDFEYDEEVDNDLSDFEFPYLRDDGTAYFMTWSEYEVWLAKQREVEGSFEEKITPFPNGCGDVFDQYVLERLSEYGVGKKIKESSPSDKSYNDAVRRLNNIMSDGHLLIRPTGG